MRQTLVVSKSLEASGVGRHSESSWAPTRRRAGRRRRRRRRRGSGGQLRRRRAQRRRRRRSDRRRRSPVTDYPWIPIQMGSCSERCNAYVSDATGKDIKTWGSSPEKPFKTIQFAVNQRSKGQTIHIMAGTYRNSRFGKKAEGNPVANLNSVSDLAIKNYQTDKPRIVFDSAGGFVGTAVARLRIEGLEISGVNADVTYDEAMKGRLTKSSHLSGRGIAIWSGHHIQLQRLKVHHCPGSGIRVNKGDYVLLSDSEVFSNAWWSSSAESAIVFAESKSIDENSGVKMIMRRNKVHDNMNKVPYYNPKYAWNVSPIASGKNCSVKLCNPDSDFFSTEKCPWQCQYGKAYQDYIIDGMGVYVTRNNLVGKEYKHGRMELSDNVAYGNGINGLVFHRTDRGSVINNIVFSNGVVPPQRGGKEDWQLALSKGRQPYAGITINNARDVRLANNSVATMYDSDAAYAMEYDQGKTKLPVSANSKNNRVCKGRYFDPKLGPPGAFVFPSKCSDERPPDMVDRKVFCSKQLAELRDKCNRDSTWVSKKYCQRSCLLVGSGYSGTDNRCCFPML